ncbi:glutaredoxin 2 [Methylobacterium sp. J-059]|jgi:glutaredoxin 2|uniref:glutaredoxin 2 n=1 Tax=Methylobacterium sp. J-059 TaxID=2836643 RepID=UPI001FBAF1E3|nr:glutaredoxin 2 [Methylobacterium sp. J-059]MCJ2038990.1 glutaredoxin 2 [Methylobacterium sp. J-059]
MKLHVYDHCPFCVKARAIFGLKEVPVELVVMLNDDVAPPERMVGRKVAPILEHEDRFTPESMDIVALIDAMGDPRVLAGATNPAVGSWIAEGSGSLYRLAITRWASAPLPEFATADARAFFTRKKEALIGPFEDRLAETAALVEVTNAHLASLEPLLRSPEAVNGDLSEDDIHLFAHLRAMSIVAGVAYPAKVDAYRRRMSERTKVPLHDDIAT